jgi:hypothetical protein
MTFSIERYKGDSKKLDTAGIEWEAPVGARPGVRTLTNPQSPSRPADPMTWH